MVPNNPDLPKNQSNNVDAEQLPMEHELQYHILFKQHPQPMWVFCLKTLRFLAVNEAAVQQYGYSEEEFLAMTLKDIRTPAGARRLDDELLPEHRRLKKNIISQHLRKDGQLIDVEITANDISFAGRDARLVMANDITERKQLERQFHRAQRMESVGTLAGGIAHDLNNLLSPVFMGVELLRNHNPSPESSKKILESIDKSARRGARLINQVLSFTRGIEGARVPLQIESIIREVESIISNTFPKNIRLSKVIAPELDTIEADPTQVTQVILNLCVNARDAMPQGGTLTIQAHSISLDNRQSEIFGLEPGNYLKVSVGDTGIGINSEDQDRIFDPFFTTKELGKGTGLGLSTVMGIAKSHGGTVYVESELGRGSVFTVFVPHTNLDMDLSEASEALPSIPALQKGNGEKVLLVEDENTVRQIARRTLEVFGYDVLTAKNGAKAIALFAAEIDEIDLIITDVMMPVMDGPSLAAAARRLNPCIPIIATSGLRLQAEAERTRVDTPYFLSKPYSGEQLISMVQQVLKTNNEKLAAR